MLASSQQLLDALEKNLGMKVQGFVAADYNGVIEAMRSNHVEVAYLGPFSYVLGTTVADIEAFATAETSKSGRTFYHSQIITRKDSGIKDIKDLKGKTFAFVDPSSTSGHLFPKAGLIKLGIDPDTYFGRVLFTGSHDANALAVANKRVDAATIADRIFDAAVQKNLVKREDIHVVWSSDPIPESPTCWRKNLAGRSQGQDQGRVPEHQGHHLGRSGQAQSLRRNQRRGLRRHPRYREGAESRSQEDEVTIAPTHATGEGNVRMIKIEGLKKSYAGRPVLQGIDLTVKSGEFLVVLGPSGAGKSTLLRCINGLTQPDEGRIVIDGTVFDSTRANRHGGRPVAMIFQHHNLVKRLSVLKNVLVGRMAGIVVVSDHAAVVPKRDVGIAMDCLARVELPHKANSRGDQLSGGEQQRVGIARALAQQPAVILCDEPVASLDPKTSRVVLGYLKAICKEEGIAVICNLHQVDYAVEFGERIVGLSAGKVVFDDTPDHLTPEIVHQIYPGLEDPGIAPRAASRRGHAPDPSAHDAAIAATA